MFKKVVSVEQQDGHKNLFLWIVCVYECRCIVLLYFFDKPRKRVSRVPATLLCNHYYH